MTRPSYAELASRTDRPAGTSWGVYGDPDELGSINLLTPERLRTATGLVRRGAVFALDLPLTEPDPPLFGRRLPEHRVVQEPTSTDDSLTFFPQASSQWDALAHVRHPEHGFYNGVDTEDIRAGGRLGVDRWAERGIAGRFLLLDLARAAAEQGRPVRFDERREFGVHDLEAALGRQAATLEPGTVLLLHTGWVEGYRAAPPEVRRRLAAMVPSDDLEQDTTSMPPAPGLAPTEDVAAWLWDHEVAAIAADNPALEAMPFSRTSVGGWLHYRVIAMLGIAVGELWRLGPLAADCAADGVYEGLLTAAPLHSPGGVGSPANALAIK